MKKRKVITNIPVRLPIHSTMLYSFLLYYFEADRLFWGIFITCYSLIWLVVIISFFNQEKIDLFESKESKTESKSKFQDKLQKLKDEKEKN